MSAPFGILRLPDRIHFGEGAAASITPLARELGDRVMLCADPVLAGTPTFASITDQLQDAGAEIFLWTNLEPELPAAAVEHAADAAAHFRPDVVVGYGGGSALDLAKLVALLVRHRGALSDYYGENVVPGPVLPLISVPTTAGTGSEVTPVAVVSDPDRELKVGVSSPYLVPTHAVVDPLLTHGAPPGVTAQSGIDALVHAVESYTAAARTPSWHQELPVFVGQNRLGRLLAGEAILQITEHLVAAVREPGNAAARTGMAYGSLLAGMAFGAAGTHLSHAIQYPVGALTKTPHGLGTGLLLPFVLRGCLPEIEPSLAETGTLLGHTGSDRALAAIATFERIGADIGLPRNLVEIGVRENQLELIANRAAKITRLAENAPVPSPQSRIPGIVAAAWRGDRD